MLRDAKSQPQEVEITSEAIASVFAVVASAPGDIEGLLFGRIRRPEAREQFSDGDASSNSAAAARSSMVVESFHPLGIVNDSGPLEYDGFRAKFTAEARATIAQRSSQGEQLLGIYTIKASGVVTSKLPFRPSWGDYQKMVAAWKEVEETKTMPAELKPIACFFNRESEVGDLGAFVCSSICIRIGKGFPRVQLKVSSIGATVEAEPVAPMLPPLSPDLRTIFNYSDAACRAMTEKLEHSVNDSLRSLNHERLDALGATLHDEARVANNLELTAKSTSLDNQDSLGKSARDIFGRPGAALARDRSRSRGARTID